MQPIGCLIIGSYLVACQAANRPMSLCGSPGMYVQQQIDMRRVPGASADY
jgi:hypothetical protein